MALDREAAPLVEAACAAPDDEAPRRALAAWLTARGHRLGAFIDAQLDRHRAEARTARPQPRPSLAEANGRTTAERAWREIVPALERLRGHERRFELVRGMPEALAVAWSDLEDAAWLEHVPLTHLDVVGPMPDGGLDALIEVARVRPLTSLALRGVGLDDDGAARLAAASWPRLRWIDLSSNRIGERGAEALVASHGLPVLVLAELGYNPADPVEGALDAYALGEVGPDRGTDEVLETVFSPWAEALWRRHGEPSWQRVLWRRGRERPHRWNVWASLPERELGREDLRGAVVLGGRIEGVRARGGRWRGASFAASVLEDCDLEEARLESASFVRGALHRVSLARASARRIDLRDARLTDCDLAGADLREAQLEGATLTDCRLRGARLSCNDDVHDEGRTRGTRFVRCDLREVDLDGRELIDAELIDCKLGGLRGAPASVEGTMVRRADLSPAADGSAAVGELPLGELLERMR